MSEICQPGTEIRPSSAVQSALQAVQSALRAVNSPIWAVKSNIGALKSRIRGVKSPLRAPSYIYRLALKSALRPPPKSAIQAPPRPLPSSPRPPPRHPQEEGDDSIPGELSSKNNLFQSF